MGPLDTKRGTQTVHTQIPIPKRGLVQVGGFYRFFFYSECRREPFRNFEGRGSYRLMEKNSLHKIM